MKVLLITDIVPSETNRNGPSALIYHLVSNRPANIDLSVALLNGYDNTTLGLAGLFSKMMFLADYSGPASKVLKKLWLRCCVDVELDINEYDLVWLYPSWNLRLIDCFPSTVPVVVTGPDSCGLVWQRASRNNVSAIYKIKSKILAKYFRFRESGAAKYKNVYFHLVGASDQMFMKGMGVTRTFYSRHPVTDRVVNIAKNITSGFHILISGSGQGVHKSALLKEIILALSKSVYVTDKIVINFVGKSYYSLSEYAKSQGLSCSYNEWVDDFSEFVAQCHLGIVVLNAGAGTKNRVLAMLANGVAVAGTEIALENIAMKNKSRWIIKDSATAVGIVERCLSALGVFQIESSEMAERVNIMHGQKRVSDKFWNKCRNIVDKARSE